MTEPHQYNKNTLESDPSEIVSATTSSGSIIHEVEITSSHAGVIVDLKPADKNNKEKGTTPFLVHYDSGTEVTITAPLSFQEKEFSYPIVDGVKYTSNEISVKVNKDLNAKVYYGLPKIGLNRTRLNFGYAKGGTVTGSQTFTIESIDGIINWTAKANVSWIKVEPSSGTDSGVVTVSVDPSGLPEGTYTGTITISDPNASNSPQKVEVNLQVYKSGSTQSPYGAFDTPSNGSVIKGGFAVTGWAMDDIGIHRVQLSVEFEFEKEPIYIGDAVFVEGARPDVEQAYPDYPENYKAGWGYMMLTNCFPNGGNGTCKIYAIATDQEGNQETLGTKTITCDNANTVKPFGTIDTPTGRTQMNKQQGQQPGYHRGGKIDHLLSITSLKNIPMDYQPVQIKKGYKENIEPKTIFPDNNNGIVFIQIKELERIEIYLHTKEERACPWENTGKWMGFQLADDQLKSLPIGSTLDIERGIFYWQPGPGFIGEYGFVFIAKRPNNDITQTHINVTLKSQN